MSGPFTVALLLVAFLGNFLLFQLWRGAYLYARKSVLMAWLFALVPLVIIIWSPYFGFTRVHTALYVFAILLNVNVFGLGLATILRYDPGMFKK